MPVNTKRLENSKAQKQSMNSHEKDVHRKELTGRSTRKQVQDCWIAKNGGRNRYNKS